MKSIKKSADVPAPTDLTSKPIEIKNSIYLIKQRYENKFFVNAYSVPQKKQKSIQSYENDLSTYINVCLPSVCCKR